MKKKWIVNCLLVSMLSFFATQALAMSSEKATKVINAAYEDLLNRKPDEAGLRNWRIKLVDEGWTEERLRNELKKSAEYKNIRADKMITAAYQDLLGRKPDDTGKAFLREKITEKNWNDKAVRNWIKKSDEYKNKR